MRLRKPPKGAKGSLPGSIAALYDYEPFESAHNKAPSQIKALKEANEKRKRPARARPIHIPENLTKKKGGKP